MKVMITGVTGFAGSYLAELACCVELERLQEPIGKQDQHASAVGGCHEYFFRPDGSVEVHPVMTALGVLALLDRHALMFSTGRARRAGAILADQQSRIDDTAHHLHVLRDQVDEGRRLLAEGDVAGLGRLLDAGWQVKKQLSARIRDDEIDRLYTAATAAGVYGAKLLGAGGGGFLFFLCPPDRQDAVRAALGDLREMPVRLGAPGTCVLEPEGSRPGDVDLESLQRAG